MNDQKMPNFLLDAQTASFMQYAEREFFAAMRLGYASAKSGIKSSWLPGSKTIEFKIGHLRVTDTYFIVGESTHSGGYTVIHWGPIPLWVMFYSGSYPKEAIPCLKAALLTTYERSKFDGGRGPSNYLHRGYRYTNRAEGNFSKFHGEETIYGPGDGIVGGHRYHGLYLATKA